MREPRKPAPTRAGLRAFAARLEKKARERAPKGADKGRARMGTKRFEARPDDPPSYRGNEALEIRMSPALAPSS
jgi:hypothetical protein